MNSSVTPGAAAPRDDFNDPNLFLEPHPFLHKLRAEAPVHFSQALDAWVLTRYQDVDQALNDPRLSGLEETKRFDALPPAQREMLLPLRRCFERWAGRSSIADHDRFRHLLGRRFTPSAARSLGPRIQAILDDLMNAAVSQGSVDVARDLARPMAMRVVAELILDIPGVPVDMLLQRGSDIAGMLEKGEEAQLLRGQEAVLALIERLRVEIHAHRREGRGGIVGVLLTALDEGIVRDEDELFANCIMFLVVGYHTTANLLVSGLQLLFDHPAERARLLQDFNLLPTAIDEMMRFHGSVASVRRMVVDSFTLRGRRLLEGQTVTLVLAAANRDPAVYPDPDRFDIGRRDNRHLGFTVGPYACMGKHVANLEAQAFFRTMLTRFPRLRPRDPRPRWTRFWPLGCELRTLPVLFD